MESELVSTLMDASMDGIVTFRAIRDDDAAGTIVDFEVAGVNPAATLVAPVLSSDVIGRRLLHVLPEVRNEGLFDRYVDVVQTGTPFAHEWRATSEAGDRWFKIRALPVATAAGVDLLVIFRETTDSRRFSGMLSELQERQRALERQALHDPLTGLGNRLLVDSRLEHALVRLDRRDTFVVVMFIDLDGLKKVNDRYGHRTGDAMITTVGQRLTRSARASDTIGRMGGDEFVVVCEDVADHDDAYRIARRLLDACTAPLNARGVQITPSASLGIAIADSSKLDAAEIIESADAAMYRAKADGGGRIEFADQEIAHRVVARVDREAALRRALELDELEHWFEPIVRATDGSVAAAQLHLRQTHVGPGDPNECCGPAFVTDLLIDPATPDDLARAIGDAAVRAAVIRARHRPDHAGGRPVTMVAAVHRSHLADDRFPDQLFALLDEHGVAPDRICLGIDEAMFAEDQAVLASGCLERLHDAGVILERCRVGTRSTATQYAMRRPIRYAQMDPALVGALGSGGDEVIAAFHAICASRNVIVVSPNIQTEAQLVALRELGTGLFQGPFISPPLRSDAFEQFVDARRPEADRTLAAR